MATLKISREALHSTLKHFVGTGPIVFLTPKREDTIQQHNGLCDISSISELTPSWAKTPFVLNMLHLLVCIFVEKDSLFQCMPFHGST